MKLNNHNSYIMNPECLEKICMHRVVIEVRQAVYLSCMLHSFFSVMPENILILKTCLLIILSKHWRKLNWDAFKQAPQEAHSGTSSQTVRAIFICLRQKKQHMTQNPVRGNQHNINGKTSQCERPPLPERYQLPTLET